MDKSLPGIIAKPTCAKIVFVYVFFLAFDFCPFCMVIRFSSPPQRPMTSDFEEFSIPDFIHHIYFLNSTLLKYNIISYRATAQARCTLLEIVECYCRGWKSLSNDVTRFYCDTMMDILTDWSNKCDTATRHN